MARTLESVNDTMGGRVATDACEGCWRVYYEYGAGDGVKVMGDFVDLHLRTSISIFSCKKWPGWPSLRALRKHVPVMFPPSLLVSLSRGMASMLVQLRPSSEITDDPSKLAGYIFRVEAD